MIVTGAIFGGLIGSNAKADNEFPKYAGMTFFIVFIVLALVFKMRADGAISQRLSEATVEFEAGEAEIKEKISKNRAIVES